MDLAFGDLAFGHNVVFMPEVLLRVVLAGLMGFVIGFDRDRKDKPMGARTYMIVCMTSAMLCIMGQELFYIYGGSGESIPGLDLSKIIGGVLTGIGFLGAGAIIKRDDTHITGATTGASIWAAGGIGMMVGFGLYALYAVAFLSVLVTIAFVPKLRSWLSPQHPKKK